MPRRRWRARELPAIRRPDLELILLLEGSTGSHDRMRDGTTPRYRHLAPLQTPDAIAAEPDAAAAGSRMKFQGAISVAAPRQAVFDRINDPVFFASCIEGVQDMTEIDPQHYTATLETRIAYIKFKFAVTVEIVERDPPNRVVARAEGTPLGIVGRLSSTSTATLTNEGTGTRITYEIDASLTGKLGSIGQPVMKSKAKEMERQFAKAIAAAFDPSLSGVTP
jgi:carbon monoxide dehydrogenase subunit G